MKSSSRRAVRVSRARAGQRAAGSVIENLEGRTLMAAGTISKVVLVDSATNQDLGTFSNNAMLTAGREYSIRAETSPATIGSVKFTLDGQTQRIETYAPYSITGEASPFGATPVDYNAWLPSSGSHTLILTPYSAAGATGTAGPAVTLKFSVGGSTTPTPTPTPTTPTPTPTTPTPTPSGSKLSVDKGTLVFNDVRGGADGPSVSLTVRNTGSSAVNITGSSLTGSDASQFAIKASGAGSLAAGASRTISVAFKPPSSTSNGIKTATLQIKSNDPTAPTLNVALRGLATQGTGGLNEPSLQRILDLYQFGIATGDSNPGSTYLFSKTESRGSSAEVEGQTLTKAGSGNVTIEPLASFAAGNPASKFGWYKAGNTGSKVQLLSVAGSTAQSVNPSVSGSKSFDPGSGAFGLYANFPALGTTMYSEDKLNAAEQTVKRKVRFFPLKVDGSTVANAYVFTTEDYNNDPSGGTDSNDFVGIIRNVKLAGGDSTGGSTSNPGSVTPGTVAGLSLQNLDGLPFADRLVMNKVQNNKNLTRVDPNTGETIQLPNNIYHDTARLKVFNTGSTPLTISDLALSSSVSNAFTVSGVSDGAEIAPGASAEISVKFVLSTRPPTATNETIDPTGGARLRAGSASGVLTIKTNRGDQKIDLAAWWQAHSESAEEPSLNTIVNKLLGYKTTILNSGQKLDTQGKPTKVGEEVLSAYWTRADSSKPVTVRQVNAWHTQGDAISFGWYAQGTNSQKTLLVHQGAESQSLFPTKTSGGAAAGSFSTGGNFGFVVGGYEYSDDKKNAGGAAAGHHMRFFPLRDRSGNVVAGSYVVGQDFQGINYDFQDDVYIITNIKPA